MKLDAVLQSLCHSGAAGTRPQPFNTGAAHYEHYLSGEAMAALVDRQVPCATVDAAMQQARDALNQHFSWSQAWRDFTDTLCAAPHLPEEREHATRSLLVGLRQLLIIRDLSQELDQGSLTDIAALSRTITDQEISEGMLLDIGLLARSLNTANQRTPGLNLRTLLPDCLQRAFKDIRCSEHSVRDRALGLLLRNDNGPAGALEALLQLLQPALVQASQEVQSAHRLRGQLDALQADAAMHAASEPAGALDRRHANLVARALQAEAHALTYPHDRPGQQAFIEARDRLQAFEQRQQTPRAQLAARHNTWAPTAAGMSAATPPPPPLPLPLPGQDDELGLLQRIDRQLNLFDVAVAAALPAPAGAAESAPAPPRLPDHAGLRKVIARATTVAAAAQPPSADLALETGLANSIRTHAPALWKYLHGPVGGPPGEIGARLQALSIRHSHPELDYLPVRGGMGAQWSKVEDSRYRLADLLRTATADRLPASLLHALDAEHVQIVCDGKGAPAELNTPEARRQLVDLLTKVVAGCQSRQPLLQAHLEKATPAEAAALGRLLETARPSARTRPAKRAQALLQKINRTLRKGSSKTSGSVMQFIGRYLQRKTKAPAGVLDQPLTFHGWAKVRDGQYFHTGRMPFLFNYQKPLAWALTRTPEERCDEATIVAHARRSTRAHVQEAVAATIDLCQVQLPQAVADNPELKALLDATDPPAPAVLREHWDAAFRRRATDPDYQAALALQVDLFLSTRLDNLRLQRSSSTLYGVPAQDRAHYAAKAAAVRNGVDKPLLLTLQQTADRADGLILLPGRRADEYLAVPVGRALPARVLVFGRNMFGGGLRLNNDDIAWLRSFYGPDRLQDGILNAGVNSGFANGGISGGDGPGATWNKTQSPTVFVPTPTADPIGDLARAHQARQQQDGQAVLRSREEFAKKQLADELETVGEVLIEVSMAVGVGEMLLPELLAASGVEIAVINGGLRLVNYGAMGAQFAAGWENMRADQDHPTRAKDDADNLMLSTLINLLLSAPDFLPSAGKDERLAAATAEAEKSREAVPAPIAAGRLRGAYRVGKDLYIPLEQGKLHRARWDDAAHGFRLVDPAGSGSGAATRADRPYQRKGDVFVQRKARTEIEPGPPEPGNADAVPHPMPAQKPYRLPAAISRTAIRDSDGEVKYLRYSARQKDGSPSNSQRLVVSAHGTFLNSESEAAAGTTPVRIPADVTVSMLTPHETFLMDAGIDACVNPPKGYRPFVSLKATASGTPEIIGVDFVPQQDHSLWKAGSDYRPESVRNALGRNDGLQNYRHHHYEHDNERDIARSLLRSRRRAARHGGTTDILVVNKDAGIDSPIDGVIADTGVQKVLDMNELQQLTNERGEKYRSIVFAHCRNLATAPDSAVSHYFMTEAEVEGQLQADAGQHLGAATAKGVGATSADDAPTLTLHVLRREDVNAPFVHHRLKLVRVPAASASAARTTSAPPVLVQFQPVQPADPAQPWDHGPAYGM